MDYKEWYVVRFEEKSPTTDDRLQGEYGPYSSEEAGMSMINKIKNRHDHVKNIYKADLIRISEVPVAGYGRDVERW